MSNEGRGRGLVGQIWNCTDIMPGLLCDDLELPLAALMRLVQESWLGSSNQD
jgi:hypothetical protein